MLFDWSDEKSDRCMRQRGFDFEFAGHIFDTEVETFVDDRADYGEARMIAFGRIEGQLYAVVYTDRDEVRWIISAFRCRQKEIERWKRRAGRTLGPGRVDRAKVKATTEADTRRHLIEDGFDPDNPLAGFRPVVSAAAIRKQSGLSQDAFAKAIGVPVTTWRNWEQGRKIPDPAARSLLALVADDPERAFKVLAR